MNIEIILERLRGIVTYMAELDKKRGILKISAIDNKKMFAATFFDDRECEHDFRIADYYIKNKLGDLMMFRKGYAEAVNSSLMSEYQKEDLATRVLSILDESDNFWTGRAGNNDWIHIDYFDAKSGYDEDLFYIEGEHFYYTPDIEDWRTAKFASCDNDIFFYKYSYYILLIAKEIADTINSNVPQDLNISVKLKKYQEKRKDSQSVKYKELIQKIDNWIICAFACDNVTDDDIKIIIREVNYFLDNAKLSPTVVQIGKMNKIKTADICTAFWGIWTLWSKEHKKLGVSKRNQEDFIPLIKHIFNKHLVSSHNKNESLPNETLLKYMAECRGYIITRNIYKEIFCS